MRQRRDGKWAAGWTLTICQGLTSQQASQVKPKTVTSTGPFGFTIFHQFSPVFCLSFFIRGRGRSPRSLWNFTYLSSAVSSSRSTQDHNFSQSFFASSWYTFFFSYHPHLLLSSIFLILYQIFPHLSSVWFVTPYLEAHFSHWKTTLPYKKERMRKVSLCKKKLGGGAQRGGRTKLSFLARVHKRIELQWTMLLSLA